MSRGATAADLAKEIHAHAVKQIRRKGGTTLGTLINYSGTTVTITLKGSSTDIPGVRYQDTFIPSSYSSQPTVIVTVTGDGDIYVLGALA